MRRSKGQKRYTPALSLKIRAVVLLKGNWRECYTPVLLLAIFSAVTGFFIFISHYILNLVHAVQPTPYMDEVFHIPQATKYFQGLFQKWDSKITTLPGLYLLSVGVLKPVSWLVGEDLCNVYTLRIINLGACVANYYLFYSIQAKLHQSAKDVCGYCLNLLSTVNMASFPILYFFTFLYYTDTVSVMLVLLLYLLHLENSNVLASAIGLLSVVVRQTNVIWVAFFAALTMNQIFKRQLSFMGKTASCKVYRHFQYFEIIWKLLRNILGMRPYHQPNLLSQIYREMLGYIIVCLGFLVFVLMNGSIVVGDKSAHEAVLHLPQLFYFALFCTVFCFPYFVTGALPFLKCVLSHKTVFMGSFSIGCLIISFTTYVHPYLLADNRHYTFYIWKRIYERHILIKYALLPVYYFGLFNIFRMMRHNDIVFKVSYAICVTLCLVPNKLLEFRYFIIPYLIWRLQINQKDSWQLMCEFILYSCINFATLYLFLSEVFYWNDSNDPQRFLW